MSTLKFDLNLDELGMAEYYGSIGETIKREVDDAIRQRVKKIIIRHIDKHKGRLEEAIISVIDKEIGHLNIDELYAYLKSKGMPW